MNKRRLFLASILASGLAFGAMAHADGKSCGKHGKAGGERSAQFMEKRMDRMAEKLGLSDDQKVQMKAIMASQADQRTARQALQAEMKALDPTADDYEAKLNQYAVKKAEMTRQSTVSRGLKRQQMAAILTPEQRAKMEEMRGKRGKGGHRGKHHGNDADK